jgi:hypothetical protein
MGAQPEQIAFITDDELAHRLEQVENGLRHVEAMIPALVREVAAIRQQLSPAG